jgi:hypothetical protein
MAALFVTMTVTFMTTTSTAQHDDVDGGDFGTSFTSIFDIPPKSTILSSQGNLNASSTFSSLKGSEDDDNDDTSRSRPFLPKTPEEIHQYQLLKSKRMAERRERAKEIIAKHRPEPGQLHRMSPDEIRLVYGNAVKEDPALDRPNHKWLRGLGNSGYYYGSHVPNFLAPVDQYYDPWAQGYRMLGGYVDCDHSKENNRRGSHDNGKNNNNEKTCSRWMMWAAVRDIIIFVLYCPVLHCTVGFFLNFCLKKMIIETHKIILFVFFGPCLIACLLDST